MSDQEVEALRRELECWRATRDWLPFTVREAFATGDVEAIRADAKHRKEWVEDRLRELHALEAQLAEAHRALELAKEALCSLSVPRAPLFPACCDMKSQGHRSGCVGRVYDAALTAIDAALGAKPDATSSAPTQPKTPL